MLRENASLNEWLEYIEHQHHKNIDMDLTRIRKVFVDLAIDFSSACVITVAGTNGKGTTCRFIEQACVKAELTVGVYASPHIVRFNERIRINGSEVSDDEICQALLAIETVRGDTSLSYFEYATLAGLCLFSQYKVDVCVLEVGLGGRLDATNIIDADIGVITSIALDHQAYLGNTTELIAAEKAGIIKNQQKLVIGYEQAHRSLQDIATKYASSVLARGIDFNETSIHLNGNTYQFDCEHARIPKQNVMTAIAALSFVAEYMHSEQACLLPRDELQALIDSLSMPGRMQVLSQQPLLLLDVAHNEAAAHLIVEQLQQIPYSNCHIVIGMLKDKNIEATINALSKLKPVVWHCLDLPTDRGEKASRLKIAIEKLGQDAYCYQEYTDAIGAAQSVAKPKDVILVVGSFIVASQCMEHTKSV